MHAQQNARLFVDCVSVVRQMRAIGCPDFAKDRAALLHNLRDSKAVPDFNQLSARNDHFAAPCQRRKRHQHPRRAIVDDNGGFRPRESRQQFGCMHIPLPPRTRFQIVFQVRILRRRAPEFVHGCFRQRRAAQIRVQNHSGRVNDRLQRARQNFFHLVRDELFHGSGVQTDGCPIRITCDACTQIRKRSTRDFDDQVAVRAFRKCRQPRLQQQFIHRRNLPQQFRPLR